MKNLIIIDHPLIKCDLTVLRNKKTPSDKFRAIIRRIASLIAYEVLRDLKTKEISIRTPLEKTKGVAIEQQIVLVPIIRAGLGFVDGFVKIMPDVRIGHIGFEMKKHLNLSITISKYRAISAKHWFCFLIRCLPPVEVLQRRYRILRKKAHKISV